MSSDMDPPSQEPLHVDPALRKRLPRAVIPFLDDPEPGDVPEQVPTEQLPELLYTSRPLEPPPGTPEGMRLSTIEAPSLRRLSTLRATPLKPSEAKAWEPVAHRGLPWWVAALLVLAGITFVWAAHRPPPPFPNDLQAYLAWEQLQLVADLNRRKEAHNRRMEAKKDSQDLRLLEAEARELAAITQMLEVLNDRLR